MNHSEQSVIQIKWLIGIIKLVFTIRHHYFTSQLYWEITFTIFTIFDAWKLIEVTFLFGEIKIN